MGPRVLVLLLASWACLLQRAAPARLPPSRRADAPSAHHITAAAAAPAAAPATSAFTASMSGSVLLLPAASGSSAAAGAAAAAGELAFLPHGQPVPPGAAVVATGAFVDSAVTRSNFGKLRVVARDSAVDELLRYRAAGWLEGYLTAGRIWDHFRNTRDYFKQKLYPGVDVWGEPMEWLHKQEAWVKRQLGGGPAAAPVAGSEHPRLWHAVGLMTAQFDGLMEGYAARRARGELGAEGGPRLGSMSREDHMFLQNNGELYDIVDAWRAGQWKGSGPADASAPLDAAASAGSASATKRLSPGQWLQDLALRGHCSALVKVAGDLSDIYVGHATWDSYTQAMRIYKHYDLGGPGFGRLSFSSYPGETFSDDDFYISESGLVVSETTDHIFDPSVYRGLSPNTLPSWLRVRAALLLANSGQEWLQVFSSHNSGTYNNQYLVIDLKRFEPMKRLAPGLLWVVEQLPGVIESGDMTDVLLRGHWGAYNVPWFPLIYNLSGYPQAVAGIERDQAQAGSAERHKYDVPKRWLMYQVAPRANIYRRNQNAADGHSSQRIDDGNDSRAPAASSASGAHADARPAPWADVEGHHSHDLDGMKALMRYNNYRQDQYSLGSPMEAVCSRGDVPYAGSAWGHVDPIPKGCYDGKVTNLRLALRLQSEVVNGPTTSHGLPPFSWSAWRHANFSYHGHPDTFDFDWERMAAEELPLPRHEARA